MASVESKVQESKKLYDELNLIFINNPEINEIGFVMSSKDYDGLENKPFVLVENKLGISFQWMIKLYSYALTYFTELKSAFEKKMNDLPERHQQLLVNELLQATRNVLLINAENLTALNLRKELINLKYIKHKDEISLLNLIFTKHPKSGEGWAHRKWVITDYFKKTGDYLDYEIELAVCKRVAEIYPKNYYSWTHRWWILQHLSVDIILKDLETMEDWVKRNISDYCGYHHRYLILTHLFNKCYNSNDDNNNNESKSEENSNEMKIHKLWEDEFNFIHKIINLYPGHESSWSYKRVLTLFWLQIAQPIVFQRNISTTVPITSLQQESQFVDSILEDIDSSYYEQQKSFAQRYLLSIYELKFKDSADFSIDIDQVKNNYSIIINDLKISFPNQLKVWEYKLNQFVGQ